MLVNPTRVLDLPAILGLMHNGGKMTVGKNGEPLPDNPFVSYDRRSMDYYYAYGIRNSFDLAMDPLTGKLWEAENEADKFDEIDVVLPSRL